VLFDAIGSHFMLTLLSAGHFLSDLPFVAPGAIGDNIPLWGQYIDFIEWCLDSLGNLFGVAGLAIIAFTIIIKTILLPLTIKSTRSSKNMQELQPKIKELQKKFGKDRQKLSQETMALYQAHGVNPMAGCLPMLIQIPIFWGLYSGISNLSRSGSGVWDSGFLWLPALHDPDPYKILPILAGIFQFIQSRMMRPSHQGKIADPQQAIMNTMMNFMPLMVVVFGWSFDSGPVIYWVTQSMYSVVQQWFITGWGSMKDWFPWLPELPDHRRLGYVVPRNIDDVVVVSGGPPKEHKGVQGWLMKRMEEAQKQQAERQAAATKARQEASSGKGGKPNAYEETVTAEPDANRSSTSYQQRVDAATKFKAKSKGTAPRSTNGTEPASPAGAGTKSGKPGPSRSGGTRKKQRRPSGHA
jgi:YidC/Oxa1 family membrane protein insertase